MDPSSTYRLQIRREFPLSAAAELTDYLRELGVGGVYVSPLLQAAAGSDHGYDTVDVTRADADRGGAQGLEQLLAATSENGLGLVVDIVPNHLGVAAAAENPAWWDVLRLGRDSAFADWFDIDWSRGRIVVPVLGDPPTLELVGDELRYFEHRFPLAPGSRAAGDDAERVHARQHYQLVSWTRANTELNYRRFFAVTTLAGVRQEDPAVFEATHDLIGSWLAQGVSGLRVDHPDGLADPAAYFRALRTLAPDAWITAEKILEPGERLPDSWPVQGTTGYDAMREVNGVFVDREAEPHFTAAYQRLTGDTLSVAEHIEAGKTMVVEQLLPAEVRRMAALVPEVEDAGPALAEVAVAFEVYRSYLPEGEPRLDAALSRAAQRRPPLAQALAALSPRLHDPDDELAQRMQQLSGATMAKGVEDTAYYRYARFIALNEVGGDPGEFGIPPARFHELQTRRVQEQPRSMISLSTHDTKRGEDVRARLAVLAEIVDPWTRFAGQVLGVSEVPNAAFGYFLAQTFAGVGPIEPRADACLHREGDAGSRRRHELDRSGRVEFEATRARAGRRRLRRPAAGGLGRTDRSDHRSGMVERVWGRSWCSSPCPGCPDVYQGTELWEDSLVDPDNRRAVDYAERRASCWPRSSRAPPPGVDDSGAAKLWVTHAEP